MPPSIVDFSGYNLTVVVGDDFELPCGVTGDPLPQIEWSFDETPINANTDRRYVVADDGTLRVTRVSRDDAGRYRCIARNPAGYDSYVVTVDVQCTGEKRRFVVPIQRRLLLFFLQICLPFVRRLTART